MVPCPENTPLPNRRVCKETRSKILSIYLRPWTLAKRLATEDVPFLTDLAEETAANSNDESGTNSVERSTRRCWRSYIGRVLPHAERGIRSFMLTCLAEGRARDDDDEKDRRKGPEILCKLSLSAIHDSVTLRTRTPHDDEDENPTEQLVLRTAQLATHISKLSSAADTTVPTAPTFHVAQLHTEVPPYARPETDDVITEVDLSLIHI